MSSLPEAATPAAEPGETTLGEHVLGQLRRLGATVGLSEADTALYGQVLLDSLAGSARRPLSLPPASPSFLSDDHTPVEFSLASTANAAPALRVLVEPGWAHGDMGDSGRAGLEAIRAMAARWDFSTEQLDALEDLFLPAAAEGPLSLWYALDLRAGGVPGVKVYLNPSAAGPEHAARTVREALRRLGYDKAFAQLPPAAGYPFLALDLGDWKSPRVKVYVKHAGMSADDACALSHSSGASAADIRSFFHTAAGSLAPSGREADGTRRLLRRSALTCHSFTEGDSEPSGFTLHIPVRDYVRDDEEALARATALLTRFGMDPTALSRSLGALTRRRLSDGVGLIAYLALVYERNRQPRITAYLSSEAYLTRPPQEQDAQAGLLPAQRTKNTSNPGREAADHASPHTAQKEVTWSRTASKL
ncbi:prenyltransferase [Streptomyces alfalfae]|uniref:Prenyltransferase n=1 Tax=Streptomyces alfalfae TaxID=1642299 RepID=A0ABN4VC98_9ACTN|nr:tryptophan dimethylallyltransferase family protein [Streptomyces alfalfae]AYA15301.1 prenyltransferase [Streptomyces fradiae]APY84966.1 prenyltransferase [Streptomyces alfalfae]QUI35214.1 prenyltransferase [Streptomyces alfalfae]RXX34945.1 prenyltransferase [Streptomyces alfalfae]RXX45848.1 prenyltransferase [Streptomyces alfalfae]